jgi:hypothetical protein
MAKCMADPKDKADILNRQSESVFTKEEVFVMLSSS